MAEIQVIRADFRLIHGQVITKWIRQTPANKILIIDDVLAKDSFMSSIYVMAAPPGIEVMIDTVDDAGQSRGFSAARCACHQHHALFHGGDV